MILLYILYSFSDCFPNEILRIEEQINIYLLPSRQMTDLLISFISEIFTFHYLQEIKLNVKVVFSCFIKCKNKK